MAILVNPGIDSGDEEKAETGGKIFDEEKVRRKINLTFSSSNFLPARLDFF